MHHTLSLFPSLFTFGLLAPLFLRLAVGILFVSSAKARWQMPYKYSSIAYGVAGLLLILGLYTQAAALLGIAILAFDKFVVKGTEPVSKEQKNLTLIMTVILLSLLFTGPGFFAMDLPL